MRKKDAIESQDTDDLDMMEVGSTKIESVEDTGHERDTPELIEQVIEIG